MTSKEALETISNIELYHREFDEDEDFDGDWKYLEYTEYDGLVREVYKQEIDTIKKDLERLEALEKENEKLKKAIEIFKSYLSVSSEVDFDTFITSYCDDDVFDLLREVINNE